jgi:plasmid maintenance system killer protein
MGVRFGGGPMKYRVLLEQDEEVGGLRGDRKGQHAIAVNDQRRICFRVEDGDAYDVEFCDDR